MFPSLPRDIPGPELLIIPAAFGLAAAAVLALKYRRKALVGAALCLVVIIGAAVPIVARHFGRWGEFKMALRAFDARVRAYEASHGPVTNKQDAARMRAEIGTQYFAFGEGEPTVRLVYMYWRKPGQVGVVWGDGGTAVFDLTTMWCVHAD